MKTFLEMLREVTAIGSFEDLRTKVRIEVEKTVGSAPFLIILDDFKSPIQRTPWIIDMFVNKAIVEWMGKAYQVPFKVSKKGEIAISSPSEVVKKFEIKEANPETGTQTKSLDSELKEAGIQILESGKEQEFELSGFLRLREDSVEVDPVTGNVTAEVVLIEQGTNFDKKRHYPSSTIQEASPMFAGLKMYANHQTPKEKRERPERDVRDWVSTIIESRYEGGCAIGKVAVHDTWLKERLQDPVARKHIGLSINTGGRISYGKVNGQKMQIVEKIILNRPSAPCSVDWVTEAGARGRVSRLLKESTRKEDAQMDPISLKEATFEDLQKENPALVKSITESVTKQVVKELKESDEAKQKDQEHEDTLKENKTFKLKEAKGAQEQKVREFLKESKVSDAVKERIVESMGVTLFEKEEDLKEAYQTCLKKELEYVNKFSKKGSIQNGGDGDSGGGSLKESLQKELDDQVGIKESKEEKKDKED